MNDRSNVVVVTGASGFIASHIIKNLLETGYRVRGTVRALAKRGYPHLQALQHSDRLTLVEADLHDATAFDDVVRGASAVIHTASPYALHVADPQRDLVDPAVHGTRNVLAACARSDSVERVVLTSSMAAVTDEPEHDSVLTEADWNEHSSLKRNPYYYSKTLAERAAWEFMDETVPGFDLVVINPYLVIGPSLSPGITPSNQLFVDLCTGTYPGIMNLTWGFVDVRDVALAHQRAMEIATASGRYLCAGDPIAMRDVVELLATLPVATDRLPNRGIDCGIGDFAVKLSSYFQPKGIGSYLRTHVGRVPRYDTSKIERQLKITFRPVTSSIADTIEDLARAGRLATASVARERSA